MTKIWDEDGMDMHGSIPDHIEKYLKASDFVKALIESRKHKQITMAQLESIMINFMLELQNYLDFEEIFLVSFRYQLLGVLFEFAESPKLSEDVLEQFAVEFFRITLQQEMLAMAVFIQKHYEVQLFKHHTNCIQAIIGAFDKNSFQARLKCHLLEQFVEQLKYSQVERLLTAIEKFVTGRLENTYLVTNVNPILTGNNIMNLLYNITELYPVSQFRGEALIEQLMDQCRNILKNIYLPGELKISVKRKDLSLRDSLYYMELRD